MHCVFWLCFGCVLVVAPVVVHNVCSLLVLPKVEYLRNVDVNICFANCYLNKSQPSKFKVSRVVSHLLWSETQEKVYSTFLTHRQPYMHMIAIPANARSDPTMPCIPDFSPSITYTNGRAYTGPSDVSVKHKLSGSLKSA